MIAEIGTDLYAFTAEGGWKLAGDDKAFTVTTGEGKSLTCHS